MAAARIHEFLRFCIVGFIGFVTDAAMLELLVRSGLSAETARIFSILIALQVTYGLHGWFTYRGHKGCSARGWVTFMISNGIGGAINYGAFRLLLAALPFSDPLIQRQGALLGATAVALLFNYWANKRFVFMQKDPS